TREPLRERADDERVVIVPQGVENGAAPGPPLDAGAMRVVYVQNRVPAQSDLVQFRQGRQGAGHAVDAVDRRHGAAVAAGAVQRLVERVRVAVGEGDDPDSVGLGNAGTLVDGIVSVFVYHQHVLRSDQARKRSHVGQGD